MFGIQKYSRPFLTGVSVSWQLCGNSGQMKYVQEKIFYSLLEKGIILELVNKYRDILECKKTDFRSIKSKNDTWEMVTTEIIQCTICCSEISSNHE